MEDKMSTMSAANSTTVLANHPTAVLRTTELNRLWRTSEMTNGAASQ
jgi:hypothetical protein